MGRYALRLPLGWYIIILCLALMLFLIDKPDLSWITWGAAVAAAVVASFSSLQGLFVWIAGLTILWQRRRRARIILAWIGAGLLTTGLYFYGWDAVQGSGISYALRHPGGPCSTSSRGGGHRLDSIAGRSPRCADGVLVFGVAISAVAIWALLSYGFRADDSSARPLGAALIWVGFLFAAGAAGARTEVGISNAGFSLYVAFDLLILIGCSSSPSIGLRPVRPLRRGGAPHVSMTAAVGRAGARAGVGGPRGGSRTVVSTAATR